MAATLDLSYQPPLRGSLLPLCRKTASARTRRPPLPITRLKRWTAVRPWK